MDKLRSALLLLLIIWKPDTAGSVRLVELRIPAHAAAGREALLGCQFDLEGDTLYSVKWYKDGREFYRYVPKNRNPVSHFSTTGVYVDLARSSSDVVTLVNLKRDSAGVYRCEVSGEKPLFATASNEKYVTIHVLPEKSPRVTGLRNLYRIGDRVTANCTTSGSRPEAQIKWLLNDLAVPATYLHGPWYRVSEPPDTIETIMQLRFMVQPAHFKNGVMELKCQATIAPLYQQETVHTIWDSDLPSHEPAENYPEKEEDSKEFFSLPDIGRVIEELSSQEDETDDATSVAKSLTTILLTYSLLVLF